MPCASCHIDRPGKYYDFVYVRILEKKKSLIRTKIIYEIGGVAKEFVCNICAWSDPGLKNNIRLSAIYVIVFGFSFFISLAALNPLISGLSLTLVRFFFGIIFCLAIPFFGYYLKRYLTVSTLKLVIDNKNTTLRDSLGEKKAIEAYKRKYAELGYNTLWTCSEYKKISQKKGGWISSIQDL